MLEVNFTIILHSPFSNPLLLRAVLKVLIVAAYCIPIYIYIYIYRSLCDVTRLNPIPTK